MTERIIGVIESNRNGFENNKEKFKSFSNDLMQSLQSLQNVILSILGIIATLLIGFYAIPNQPVSPNEDIIQQTIYIILEQSLMLVIITLIVGLFLYLLINIFKWRISQKIWNIEKEYHKALTTQNFMKGFIEKKAFELYSIDKPYLCNLMECFIVVEVGLTKCIIDQYEKNKSLHFLFYYSKWRNESSLIGNFYHNLIKNAHFTYDKHEKIFSECVSNDYEKEYFKELKELAKASL